MISNYMKRKLGIPLNISKYYCTKCKKEHLKSGSRIGLKHKKYAKK